MSRPDPTREDAPDGTQAGPAELNRRAALDRAEAHAEERQRERDAMLRQRAVDAAWERTVRARAEAEAEAWVGCHRRPGDPDWG